VPDQLNRLLELLGELPIGTAYLLLGLGAAIENVFPPVPSDTFVVLGGVLADRGVLDPVTVLAIVWLSNVAGALLVYAMARRYGRGIFASRWGHWLLRPHQLTRVADFYSSYGILAIFASRFLPVLRVVVPAFAGISGLSFWATALSIAFASAVWYSVVLYAGMLASRNLGRVLELLGHVNNGLLIIALLLIGGILILWWRTRKSRREDRGNPER